MKVILYDGECGFCNAAIRFVWKRDREGTFSFAAIQSDAGRDLLRPHGIDDPPLDTMYLIDGGRLDARSTAALRVGRELPGYRLLCSLGLLVPRILRDAVYRLVARHRSRLSNNRSACELPPPEVRERFLDGKA